MKLPDFTYHRPRDLESALHLLAELGDEAKVIAGGQSLLPMLALRLAQPAHLIDIADVEGLGDVVSTADGLRVGASVTQRAVERDAAIAAECPLLVEAVGHIGHQQTRARGTVCGSMVHADPSAELPAVALALDSTFTIAGQRGLRQVEARDFFQGFMTTDVGDDEILIAVTFPRSGSSRGSGLAEVCRRRGDFALVGAACSLELTSDDHLDDVRVALFGVAATPVRVPTVEASLRGARADAPVFDLDELAPPSDQHATASYRSHVARHVIATTLQMAITSARGRVA